MSLESILSSILHTVEKERLCYCSHKLFMDVSLQNMQSCSPVYQVFLQPRVMQIKACRTSRLQILPPVRFPWSTVIMPRTRVSTNTVFRSGCCPSIGVWWVWKVFAVGSCWPGEWCSDSQALQHSHSVWPISLSTITCGTDLSPPLSPLYLSTALLNHLAPGNVSDQACTAWSKARCGWSWADANCALCCYLFGGKF